MSLVADNTWQAEINFDGQSDQRFKFDVEGDWSHNYGDNGADGTLDPSGSDIYTSVTGRYLVQMNDADMNYQLIAVE